MSTGNVDILRRAWEAFNEGDPSVFLGLYDPAIVLCPDGAEPVVGAAAVERWFADQFSVFAGTYYVDIHQLVGAGDSVIAIGRARGRGKRSGVEVRSQVFYDVYTLRGGRLIRIDAMIHDMAAAYALVGLSPPHP